MGMLAETVPHGKAKTPLDTPNDMKAMTLMDRFATRQWIYRPKQAALVEELAEKLPGAGDQTLGRTRDDA